MNQNKRTRVSLLLLAAMALSAAGLTGCNGADKAAPANTTAVETKAEAAPPAKPDPAKADPAAAKPKDHPGH